MRVRKTFFLNSSFRWGLWALLCFLQVACASLTKKKKATPAVAHSEKATSSVAVDSVEGEVSYTQEEEPDDGEEDTEEASADAEPVEGTPTDLGDLETSETVRAEEVQADLLARRTFPLVQNEFVDQWIRYFTGRGRSSFEKWVSRTPRYAPLIRKVMKQDGLPEDLVYLAMIESGFNPKARSHARAVGPWQFIKSTGKRYGLRVDAWVDERRDIVKSTHAAAQYLKELHQIFGSWYLAAASYNAGEGKVLNAIRRDRSRDFWTLARRKKNFRAETRNYVPKIIAAALISKTPQDYGYGNVVYESPLEWELVQVPAQVHLRGVSEVMGIDLNLLKLMNAELIRGVTPPGSKWWLKVPLGQRDLILAKLPTIQKKKYAIVDEYRRWRPRLHYKKGVPLPPGTYRVQAGDTLWDLARRAGTSVSEIKRLNELRSPRDLRAGVVIRVPAPTRKN